MSCFSQPEGHKGIEMSNSTVTHSDGNTLFPIVLSIVAAAATGVLWAYANPIQLVPGIIQWRIFAFLPPLVGILLGRKSGFICGYLGTIIWSLLAGTFIPAHSLFIDGIVVGLTGFIPGVLFNPKITTFNRATLIKIAVTCLIVGLLMVFSVSTSLSYLGIFPFWWGVTYLGLSDIVPMLIGTPLLIIPALKILQSAHPSGFTRF